jgi:hypothetical protein
MVNAGPPLRIGFVGIEQEQYFFTLLKTRSSLVEWERSAVADADALWVAGLHAQRVRDGLVRVPSADARKPATLLNLEQVDRPVAFTLPLAIEDLPHAMTFDPRSVDSVTQAIRRFEATLLPLATQLALGREIAQRRGNLTSPIYHLSVRGALVAVIDLGGEIGLHPTLSPAALASAEWSGRPASARMAPEHFGRVSMGQLMWQYVNRTHEDLLPPKYRRGALYFRKTPQVAHRLLRDAHLAVLSELGRMPQTFTMLQQNTGLGDAEMAQTLGALYFAGSLTTDAAKAAPLSPASRTRTRARTPDSLPSSLLVPGESQPDAAGPGHALTVPAALEPRRR